MELYTKRQNCYSQFAHITAGNLSASIVKRFLFALTILLTFAILPNNNSYAQFAPEVRTVGIFELRFYSGSKEDPNNILNSTPGNEQPSTRPFTTEMIDNTVKYVGYWEQLIDTSRVEKGYKIIVNFAHVEPTVVSTANGLGRNIVNIINNGAKPSTTETDAIINFGGRFDRDTIIHEFGHVLGFSRPILAPYLVDIYGEKWTDANGNFAVTGAGSANDGVFNLYEDAGAENFKYPMFLGKPNGAIEELIGSVHNHNGSLDLSKLNILSQSAIQGTSTDPSDAAIFGLDLSHTGNMHSLMSYGAFINMPFMPEIELAMLEELGYSVNRRKAFGHSYYKRSDNLYDGQVTGVGYDSDFIFGVGAHVIMDNLKLLQSADISSRGEEGAGIRIDGSKNTINIDKDAIIEASGENAVGLFAAWGNGNILINRGNISATGEGGVGVKLSVEGYNAKSYYTNTYTGSEKRIEAQHYRATQELNGALVDRFDISGKITGNEYAIFISNTAHVKEINIMNGAEIYGNIKSEYTDGNRVTALSFGKTADAAGAATGVGDPNFKFVLNNELFGQDQFDVTTFGGTTTIGKDAFVKAKSATIKSNSQFNIESNYKYNTSDKVYITTFNLGANAILGINTMYSEGENTPYLKAGSATLNAAAKLDITSFKKGTYTVLNAGTLTGSFDTSNVLVAGQAPTARHFFNMTTAGNTIKLTLDATNIDLKWKGGNGTWDNGKKSWDDNGVDDVFINGDTVLFDKGAGIIDVPVSVEAASAAITNGAKYRFSGAPIFVTNNLSITQTGTEARFAQNVQTNSLTVNNSLLGIAAECAVAVAGDAEFKNATLEIGTGETNTSAGKISVAGKATVSGGVVNIYGAQRSGIKYLFLEAGDLEVDAVAGGFVLGATANGQRGIVSYDANVDKYWVTISGLLVDHVSKALTPNQRNFGAYLNKLAPHITEFNDMNEVLGVFENLAVNAPLRYRSALDETAGNIYATAGSAGIQNTTIANRTIATYLRRPPLSEVVPCHICRGVCQHLIGKPTSWITIVGMGGATQNDSSGGYGYSQSSGGSVFGVDIMRRVGCHFGIYGSAMENVLTTRGIKEHSRSHEFMGGLYFRLDNSIGYFLLNNGYGFNQYKTDRTMYEFDYRKASSSHNSFNTTVYSELGTYYLDPIFHWHAYVGLQYAGNYQEAITEHGAGALDIISDPVSTTSMRGFLGVRTERFEKTFMGGMISGDFNFAWMHEYIGKTQTEFIGRFEGQFKSNSPFESKKNVDDSLKYKVKGTNTGRDWAIFGASLGYDYGRLRLFGGYDAYLSGYQSLHTGTLGAVYVW
jgi:hypothetical protein